LSEVDVQAPKGLPEPLPDGERILWQRSPRWWPYARRVFKINSIAFYFTALICWIAGAAYAGSGELSSVLRSLSWAIPPAAGVLAILALLGWLYAKTSIYTVTDKRIVIQSGLAFPAMINLPFAQIDKADLKIQSDGTGDIELSLSGPRVLYSMLWPNVRLFRIGRPKPLMSAIPEPQQAADVLGHALSREHDAEPSSATEQTPEDSENRRTMPA